jgi:taurine dioxygenase
MACNGVAVRRLSGALGVEIEGVDVGSAPVEVAECVGKLLRSHLLVVARSQRIDRAAHATFARALGVPIEHPYHGDAGGEFPELLIMRSDRPVADFWHSDETFMTHPPDIGILRIVQRPRVGGDTVWTNQHLAYERLSADFKRLVEPLRGLHVTPDGDRRAEHPLVLWHPVTGAPALYANRQFTRAVVGLTSRESRALLDVLFEVSEHPDGQCRVGWRDGDVAIWDNRVTQHRAIGDYTEHRHVERVAVTTQT